MKTNFFYEADRDKTDGVVAMRGKDFITLPHFHRCIELLYVMDGALDCDISGERFTAVKDDVIFVHKCAVHSLNPAPTFNDCILVVGPKYSEDFLGLFQTQTMPAHLCDKDFNRRLLMQFEALTSPDEINSELVIKGRVNIIIGSLLQNYKCIPAPATPKIDVIVSVLNYIDEHYAEDISLETISSVFGYNKYYFSRLFNLYVKDTLNGYINMIRVRNIVSAAKKQGSGKLSDLVFSGGFDSITTFYRSFSKYYDLSPREVLKRG